MKNNLSDLNNHLFAMLEELGDGDSADEVAEKLWQVSRRATDGGSTT
ncbi:MAG: hypothetical protein II837_17020 [Treponema sp.]|nr:hypothetical protein [Treponema sp.]MBQ7165906.1 hypothetical protein [Treponema sp.]